MATRPGSKDIVLADEQFGARRRRRKAFSSSTARQPPGTNNGMAVMSVAPTLRRSVQRRLP